MGVAGGLPFDANEELFEGFDPGGVPGVRFSVVRLEWF